MAEFEEDLVGQVDPVDALIDDPLPQCLFCGGNTLFIGHETPDRVNPLYMWWFLCGTCRKTFSQTHNRRMKILFSTKR